MELDTRLVSKEINALLWNENKTLSTAESCTAGRIASVITAVPGSSKYFRGGLICYQDDIKVNLLNVRQDSIDKHDVVSEEVVKEMVYGAIKLFNSDYAVAISGYAGPGGPDNGRNAVVVGNIWIAVGNKDEVRTKLLEDDHGRDKNLIIATNTAMHMLCDYLKEKQEAKNADEAINEI